MWSKNGMPVAASDRPSTVEADLHVDVVSLVERLQPPRRLASGGSRQDLLQGAEERVVLGRVPTVTRRQPSAGASRRSCAPAPSARPGARQTSSPSTVVGAGTARSWRPRATVRHRQVGQARPADGPVPRRRRPPARSSRRRTPGPACRASWVGGVEVVGQDHLLQLGHQPRRADQVAEAGGRHRPRLGVGAGDDQRPLFVDEAAAPTTARTGRRPRRPPARSRPRSARVDDTRPPGRAARPDRSGCWASRGTRPPGGARRGRRSTSAGSSAKSSSRSPSTTVGAGDAGRCGRGGRRWART